MNYELTIEEESALRDLHSQYVAAKSERDYKKSDQLRASLIEWGAMAPNYDRWHPVFESRAHRLARIESRHN